MDEVEEAFELVKTINNLGEAYILCYEAKRMHLLASIAETIYENAQKLCDLYVVGKIEKKGTDGKT